LVGAGFCRRFVNGAQKTFSESDRLAAAGTAPSVDGGVDHLRTSPARSRTQSVVLHIAALLTPRRKNQLLCIGEVHHLQLGCYFR